MVVFYNGESFTLFATYSFNMPKFVFACNQKLRPTPLSTPLYFLQGVDDASDRA